MNKIPLLEKFAAQSLVYVDTGLSDGKELIFSKEKFAELIVRECIDIAQDRAAFDGFPPNDVNHIIDEIREHFGVEE
jgi:hypothetical protein